MSYWRCENNKTHNEYIIFPFAFIDLRKIFNVRCMWVLTKEKCALIFKTIVWIQFTLVIGSHFDIYLIKIGKKKKENKLNGFVICLSAQLQSLKLPIRKKAFCLLCVRAQWRFKYIFLCRALPTAPHHHTTHFKIKILE